MARIDLENVAHSYDQDAIDRSMLWKNLASHGTMGGAMPSLDHQGGKTTMLNIMSG